MNRNPNRPCARAASLLVPLAILCPAVLFAQVPDPLSPLSTVAPTPSAAPPGIASLPQAGDTLPPFPAELTTQPARYTTVTNGPYRYDTQGRHINVHGGGILYYNGIYYWYGEYRNPKGPDVPKTAGVGCYTSRDLCNWKNEGVVLATIKNDPASDFAAGCTIERPKVIYNARTRKFVMWFHLELKDKGYSAARAALAVGDTPLGPFQYLRSGRVNAGKWPINMPPTAERTPLTDEQAKAEHDRLKGRAAEEAITARRDFSGGQMSRDMTLYVDDGGKAYLLTSAEGNATLHIHELTDDYLGFTGKYARIEPGGSNEAPAMCKHDGKYYILCSGTSGWAPNSARVLVADNIYGPYKNVGNPCEGTNPSDNLGPNKTFGGQSTYIFPLPGKRDALVAMFDIWRPKVQLIESGHIWLPIEWQGDRMIIRWQNEWNPMTAFR